MDEISRYQFLRRKYPTIGYLGGPLVIEQLWQGGLIDAAKNANINLIIFSGGILENPHGFDSQRTKIFDLVGEENIDGLFIGSDYLGHYVGAGKIQEFCEQYRPIPLVKNEPLIEGYPTFLFDFYQGMYDLVSHLVEVHRYTKIAFISGPEQSNSIKDRYKAYRDVLEKHQIQFDENLVVEGTVYAPSGDEAVRILFDQRKLVPGMDVQAIVAFNDYIAVDALNALHKRSISVPDQVAIVGFDDDEIAFTTEPRLTTVRLPFYAISLWGVDTLISIFQGNDPSGVTTLAVPLVIRQSCGCKKQNIASYFSVIEPGQVRSQPRRTIQQEREHVLGLILDTAGFQSLPRYRQDIEALLDLFISEFGSIQVGTISQGFSSSLESILRGMVRVHYNIEVIYNVLVVMQQEALQIYSQESERAWIRDLFQQSYVITSDLIQRMLISEKNQATYLDELLHSINQEMATTMNIQGLVEILATNLPRLGIPACYLALYEDPEANKGYSKLMLAYNENGRMDLEKGGLRYYSKELIPIEMQDNTKLSALVLLSLYYREEQMGFVVFEIGPAYGGLYEALREQISSALKKIELHQKMVEARRVAEDSDRLKSRFLSIVAHELRTPLSMIVSLSGILLEGEPTRQPALPLDCRNQLEVIHTTGQHLDRLILDVLDLGRSQLGQLKLDMEVMDFGELLKEIQLIGEKMASEKHLTWRSQIPNSIPLIKGDHTRLRQVLLNLFSNACKFTSEGEIGLLVTVGESEMTVAVSDTGIGVPLQEQETIFDEFYQSDRTAARGYGGMGLGLAITRRLVELHGGKIHLISSGEEGRGTTFYFTLPIPLDRPIQENKSAWQFEPEKMVLVITSKKNSGNYVASHLDRHGYKVMNVEIDDENRWLDTIRSNPCGGIVLDCEPDAQWGWEVIKSLRQQQDTSGIPTIFYQLLPENNRGAFLNMNIADKPIKTEPLLQYIADRNISDQDHPDLPKIILVVDDEQEALKLQTQILKTHLPTCRVVPAENGRIALQIMQHLRPDLVLLDLMMPEIDGFGVLQGMQLQESLRTVPVIVLTNQVLTEEMIQRLNRSVAGFLGKGLFGIEETLGHIETALSRSKNLGSEPQRIARRAMSYIQLQFREQITRVDIAQHIGVNERYLTHCFRQEVGITPMDYLNRYRIKIARQLLDSENKSITEIGLDVGFQSSAYFSRVFHNEMGMSPREYLHRNR